MTTPHLRRLWPQRLRTRLAVFYGVLFLVVGVVLLALTYVLAVKFLAPSITPSNPLPSQDNALLALCKPTPTAQALLAKCNRLLDFIGGNQQAARGDFLAELQLVSLIGLAVLLIVAAGLGWLVSGRALRPVRSLTDAARQASEMRLGQRLALTGPDDELKQLADTFDVMLERLDTVFTSQKQFVANAAHELRTPLTAMRTAIEVTLSKPTRTPEQLEAMAARVKHSVEQAEATIEAMLTLATSELGPSTLEPVDLATAAEDALDASAAAINLRQLTVDTQLEPAETSGDRVLIERMIANLVENAVRHNIPGGWLGVRTAREPDGAAVFEIANTGPEVPPEQVESLFDPFVRTEQRLNSHDGVGLGLSIARTIATTHDAAIDARPRAGGGLEITVRTRAVPAHVVHHPHEQARHAEDVPAQNAQAGAADGHLRTPRAPA